jgi:hypothetical protein
MLIKNVKALPLSYSIKKPIIGGDPFSRELLWEKMYKILSARSWISINWSYEWSRYRFMGFNW